MAYTKTKCFLFQWFVAVVVLFCVRLAHRIVWWPGRRQTTVSSPGNDAAHSYCWCRAHCNSIAKFEHYSDSKWKTMHSLNNNDNNSIIWCWWLHIAWSWMAFTCNEWTTLGLEWEKESNDRPAWHRHAVPTEMNRINSQFTFETIEMAF